MSGIYRTVKNKEYFYASNEPFNDERLSWEARGVIGYLLSKPDGWECRNFDLIKKGPAGEHKLKRILSELKEYGYLRRFRVHKDDGTFGWVTEIYESPKLNPDTIWRLSTDGSATDGLPIDGKPHDIDNTESDNTKLDNTNKNSSSENLSQHFSTKTNLFPQSLIAQQEWEDDCQEILDKAGNDEEYARHLMDDAIATLKTKKRYTYKSPGSLLVTISNKLKQKEESVKNGYSAANPNVVPPPARNADGSYNI